LAKKTTAKSRADKELCVFFKRQEWKNGLALGSKMGQYLIIRKTVGFG